MFKNLFQNCQIWTKRLTWPSFWLWQQIYQMEWCSKPRWLCEIFTLICTSHYDDFIATCCKGVSCVSLSRVQAVCIVKCTPFSSPMGGLGIRRFIYTLSFWLKHKTSNTNITSPCHVGIRCIRSNHCFFCRSFPKLQLLTAFPKHLGSFRVLLSAMSLGYSPESSKYKSPLQFPQRNGHGQQRNFTCGRYD